MKNGLKSIWQRSPMNSSISGKLSSAFPLMKNYDLAVIGAGQGGLPAAFMAARLGANVALIEMHEVGGT